MTAPWAGTPFEAEYHRLHDKVERLEEEVHLWHSCVHEPGEIDERLRENATLRAEVARQDLEIAALTERFVPLVEQNERLTAALRDIEQQAACPHEHRDWDTTDGVRCVKCGATHLDRPDSAQPAATGEGVP